MRSDLERWNVRYKNREPSTSIVPDPLLVTHRDILTARGAAIDIAGGIGDNGLYLAQLGYRSLIVDASETGLRLCRHKALANKLDPLLVVADLDRFALPCRAFDVVLVFRYLNRGLIPSLRDCLKDNGILFFKTFNRRHLDKHPDFPQEFVLRVGELEEWFSEMRCLYSSDGRSTDTISYWIGHK